jgi:hypothetical protein
MTTLLKRHSHEKRGPQAKEINSGKALTKGHQHHKKCLIAVKWAKPSLLRSTLKSTSWSWPGWGDFFRLEIRTVPQNIVFRYSLPVQNRGVDCVRKVEQKVLLPPRDYVRIKTGSNYFFVVSYTIYPNFSLASCSGTVKHLLGLPLTVFFSVCLARSKGLFRWAHHRKGLKKCSKRARPRVHGSTHNTVSKGDSIKMFCIHYSENEFFNKNYFYGDNQKTFKHVNAPCLIPWAKHPPSALICCFSHERSEMLNKNR